MHKPCFPKETMARREEKKPLKIPLLWVFASLYLQVASAHPVTVFPGPQGVLGVVTGSAVILVWH